MEELKVFAVSPVSVEIKNGLKRVLGAFRLNQEEVDQQTRFSCYDSCESLTSVLSTSYLLCEDQPDSLRKPPSQVANIANNSHAFFVASAPAFAGTIGFHYETNSWNTRIRSSSLSHTMIQYACVWSTSSISLAWRKVNLCRRWNVPF